MNNSQLACFKAVADSGSVSRASAATGLAEGVLRRSVSELEAELRVTLMARRGRGLALTKAGERLLSHCEEILRRSRIAQQEVRAIVANPSTQTVLGMPPTVATVLAGRVAAGFVARLPGAKLKFIGGMSGHIREWLTTGRIDVGIVYGSPNLVGEELWTEELFLIVPARSLAMRKEEVAFAELENLPLILPGPSHGLRRLVDRHAEAHSRRLNVVLEADSLTTILELVERRQGYTILPRISLATGDGSPLLRLVRIRDPKIERTLTLASSPSKPISQTSRELLEVIREEAKRFRTTNLPEPEPAGMAPRGG